MVQKSCFQSTCCLLYKRFAYLSISHAVSHLQTTTYPIKVGQIHLKFTFPYSLRMLHERVHCTQHLATNSQVTTLSRTWSEAVKMFCLRQIFYKGWAYSL